MSAEPLMERPPEFIIHRAIKAEVKARIALIGPSGSGKTYTALQIALGLVGPEAPVLVIDTERGSASKYADEFTFDTLPLLTFSPETYVKALEAAENYGAECIIIDSLTHAWTGREGALEQVDKFAAREKGNSFGAWRHVTPMHNGLIDAMLGCSAHLIVTMRSKTEYILEQNGSGKQVPKKVGMAPIQREGMEYEFDVVAEMDPDHNLIVTKTRYRCLDGAVVAKPGPEVGQRIRQDALAGAPLRPEDIRSLGDAKTAMQAAGLTGEDVAAAKAAAGFLPEVKLADLPLEGLRAVYAKATEQKQEEA